MPLGPKKSRHETAPGQRQPVADSESDVARDYPWFDPNDDFDDFDDFDEPADVDPDDADWDVFLADDDELDPQPAYNDFWPEGECK